MSRPKKAVVDYFPHYVNHGKTMFTIESKYGNDGYSFWFKILELLGGAEHHFLDCNDTETWEFLLAKTKVSENTAESILDTCSKLGAIDQQLWNNKIIRSDNFIENLDSVYKRREVSVYSNEDVLSSCKQKSQSMGVSSNKKPQSKVKDSKVYQSIGEETRVEERIVKENPNPVSGGKNKQPGEIQEQKTSRARAHEKQFLLEPEYYNLLDLMGGELEPGPQETGFNNSQKPEPDKKVILLSSEPSQPPATKEPEPKQSEEPKTKTIEPKVGKIRVPDWDDEPVLDRIAPVRFIEAREPQEAEELESMESEAVIKLYDLQQDRPEFKPTLKMSDFEDWQ
jgi:hypothetical protein